MARRAGPQLEQRRALRAAGQGVFAINANATPPAAAGPAGFYAHVGTVLFNMVVNPISEKVYVSNTDAINEVRFEGPGILGTTVNGRLHEARISVLDVGSVTPIHLNKPPGLF